MEDGACIPGITKQIRHVLAHYTHVEATRRPATMTPLEHHIRCLMVQTALNDCCNDLHGCIMTKDANKLAAILVKLRPALHEFLAAIMDFCSIGSVTVIVCAKAETWKIETDQDICSFNIGVAMVWNELIQGKQRYALLYRLYVDAIQDAAVIPRLNNMTAILQRR